MYIFFYKNVLPVLITIIIVIIVFFIAVCMAYVFDDGRRNDRSSHVSQISKKDMVKVNVPFTFKLKENCSTDNEVHFLMSSQVCYKLMAFWGVTIQEFHKNLSLSWAVMHDAIEQGTLFHDYCQLVGPIISNTSHEEKLFKVPIEPFDVGIPPRTRYPLVIIIGIDSTGVNLKPEQAVALISIIHLKDTVIKLPTGILGQYLKQANGKIWSLQKLYLPCNDSHSDELVDDIDSFDFETTEELCVVCQSLPFSRVILPCKHTCVCGICFSKLSSCPLCRSPIMSYFCIKNEEYLIPKFENNSSVNKRWFTNVQGFLLDFLDNEELLY